MTQKKMPARSLIYKNVDRMQFIIGFYHVNNALRRTLGYQSLPIVMYHSVGEPDVNQYNLSLDAFRSQMHFLCSHCRCIQLKDVSRQLQNVDGGDQKIPVVITFDDGYRNLYQHIHPVMEEMQIPYTVFIPTAFIRPSGSCVTDEKPRLSSREILALAESELVDIGSHTVSHPSLSRLASYEVREELTQSKKHLEDLLSRPVDMFAYPYGTFAHYSKRIAEHVAQSGYRLAVTACFNSMNRAGSDYFLRRIFFYEKDTPSIMQAKLAGAFDWYFYAEFVDFLLTRMALKTG
jgi:peptidoglycan/xylan/chitin deacetylase (PgdA/CDA1 family)